MLWRPLPRRNSSKRKKVLHRDRALSCGNRGSSTMLWGELLARRVANKPSCSLSYVAHFTKMGFISSGTPQTGHLSCFPLMPALMLSVSAERRWIQCRSDALVRDMSMLGTVGSCSQKRHDRRDDRGGRYVGGATSPLQNGGHES